MRTKCGITNVERNLYSNNGVNRKIARAWSEKRVSGGNGSSRGLEEGGGNGAWNDHCMKNLYEGCAAESSIVASDWFERKSGNIKLGDFFAVCKMTSYVEIGTEADR